MDNPPSFIERPQVHGRDPKQLVCFSHLRWNFVYQRPQHILTAASEHFDVIYVEEPRYEANCRARVEICEVAPKIKVVVPCLPEGLCAAEATILQRCLISAFLDGDKPSVRIKWYYTPMALSYSSSLPADLTVFDCMDELSNFHGAPENLKLMERKLMNTADVVFTGGRSLYEAKEHMHDNIHCFPSSIDATHFGKAKQQTRPDPADQAAIAHPRIGFFGVIDERLDIGLLKDLAKLRPDLHFVMIGPVVKIDPDSLPQAHNIHWLGGKPYDQLPSYLAHWDVGFMPFALNAATRFISPTKTPEFLAAGLPVASTPVKDVVAEWGRPKLVSIASTVVEMSAAIDDLLKRDPVPWSARVNQKLATMSWSQTWEDMYAIIEQALTQESKSSAKVVQLALPRAVNVQNSQKATQRTF
jgi:Glycosyl transferases group 1